MIVDAYVGLYADMDMGCQGVPIKYASGNSHGWG